jgi:hypothetical protein
MACTATYSSKENGSDSVLYSAIRSTIKCNDGQAGGDLHYPLP